MSASTSPSRRRSCFPERATALQGRHLLATDDPPPPPGAARSTLPGIAQVLLRTTALSSIHTLEKVRRECDWYLKVPVERFGLLAFEEIESIVEGGYQHARSELAAEGARRLGTGDRS